MVAVITVARIQQKRTTDNNNRNKYVTTPPLCTVTPHSVDREVVLCMCEEEAYEEISLSLFPRKMSRE